MAINHEIMTPHLSVMWSDFGCAVPFKECVCVCVSLKKKSVHMADHVNDAASRHTFVSLPEKNVVLLNFDFFM